MHATERHSAFSSKLAKGFEKGAPLCLHTYVMNIREVKSGAGERKNEMGGCTESSEA